MWGGPSFLFHTSRFSRESCALSVMDDLKSSCARFFISSNAETATWSDCALSRAMSWSCKTKGTQEDANRRHSLSMRPKFTYTHAKHTRECMPLTRKCLHKECRLELTQPAVQIRQLPPELELSTPIWSVGHTSLAIRPAIL